jgi:hypothetical protein
MIPRVEKASIFIIPFIGVAICNSFSFAYQRVQVTLRTSARMREELTQGRR